MRDELHAALSRFQDCIETRDRGLAEALLDEDFALVLVHPAVVVMNRERWLVVLDDYVVDSLRVAESVVDVAGDVAVVLHRDQMSATLLGEDRSGTFIITDIWRLRSDGWRIWRRHSTPLTAGQMPGQ